MQCGFCRCSFYVYKDSDSKCELGDLAQTTPVYPDETADAVAYVWKGQCSTTVQ